MPYDYGDLASPADAGKYDYGALASPVEPTSSKNATPEPTGAQGASPKLPSGPMDYLKAAGNVMGALQAPFQSIPKQISSDIAGPVSDVAGLGAIPLHAAGAIKTQPQQVQQNVAQAMSPKPMTNLGQYSPSAYIGKLIESLANKAQGAIAPESASPGRAALGYLAKGGIEQAPNIAGALVGGRSAATLPARQAELSAARALNAPKDELARQAEAAGYIRPPEHGAKAAISGAAGKTKAEKTISVDNAKNAEVRLGAEVGIPDGEAPTEEARDNAKEVQYQRYADLTKAVGPQVQVTNDFRDSIVNTLKAVNEDVDVNPSLSPARSILRGFVKRISPQDASLESSPAKTKSGIFGTIEKTAVEQPFNTSTKGQRAEGNIGRTLEQASSQTPGPHAYGEQGISASPTMPVPTGHIPTLPTRWVMHQISDLRLYAKADAVKREWGSYETRMGIANQLENLMEDNLAQRNKGLVGQFHDARVKLAQLHLLDKVADDTTGQIDLVRLAQLSKTPAYRGALTGEFKLAADFARTYKKATQRMTGEAVPRFTVLDGLFAASGATSALFGHPGGLGIAAAEIGGRLAVPWMAHRGMLQNKIPSYRAGTGTKTIAPLLGQAMSGNQLSPPPQ